jgi:hypothetical protein
MTIFNLGEEKFFSVSQDVNTRDLVNCNCSFPSTTINTSLQSELLLSSKVNVVLPSSTEQTA